MFATKAFELIKEFHRSQNSALPPFDESGLRQIFNEMEVLAEQNSIEQDTTANSAEQLTRARPGVYLRHASLERNKQCVLAYIYNRINRIRDMRWTKGSVIPEAVRFNMTERENQYFKNYNKILAKYMRSVTGDLDDGFDVTQDMKPPKSGNTCVRVLKDWELNDDDTGEVINLKKEAILFLDDIQGESLVRQGIVERVNSSQLR